MIGVKDYDTNTLWRLSDKVYRETDLEDLNGKINLGDVIVIITVDRIPPPSTQGEFRWRLVIAYAPFSIHTPQFVVYGIKKGI